MNKIKLTDLSHLESLNDEMAYLKGGDDPEKAQGPLCWGCKCPCQCSNANTADTTANNVLDTTKGTGTASGATTFIAGVIVGRFIP